MVLLVLLPLALALLLLPVLVGRLTRLIVHASRLIVGEQLVCSRYVAKHLLRMLLIIRVLVRVRLARFLAVRRLDL